MKKRTILFAASTLLLSSTSFARVELLDTKDNIHQLVRFLVSDRILTLNTNLQPIPLSFFVGNKEDIAAYFGDFICNRDNTCPVVDTIYHNPFAILGRGLSPRRGGSELEWLKAQAQIERTEIKYGTDIYHAATWQIALALAADQGFLPRIQAEQLVANQLETITNPFNRAIGEPFRYGHRTILFDPRFAFTFRWLATSYYNIDPFFEGRYQNFVSADFDPITASTKDPFHLPAAFYTFVTTWSDRRPLTGKNAWAQLIGPLQAELLLTRGRVSAFSPALINAMNTLYAFSLLQTGIGAFYFAPRGTEDSQALIPPSEILIEDNFVILAGLQILKTILEKTEQTPEVNLALHRVRVMLHGGTTLHGFQTNGLLSFLFNGAFDTQNGIFFTRGSALIPSSTVDWRPNNSDVFSFTTVNTNLWAISALGVETIDNWFGAGTSLKIWQIVRDNGGYFKNGELWGLGYTLINNVGVQPETIMTTEATAAAINALRSLIEFYGINNETSFLLDDLTALRQNIFNLRNDLYLEANFNEATPGEFFTLVPRPIGQAFLYASRRFPIPLDWHANTLASINANAWVLMNNFNFNPLQYRGKLAGENYPIPETVDILARDLELPAGTLSKTVRVQFTGGNLREFKRLALRYSMERSPGNWKIALVTNEREGIATLPQGTQRIALSIVNNEFANVCEINPATDICIDDECMNVRTINALWSSSGLQSCSLSQIELEIPQLQP